MKNRLIQLFMISGLLAFFACGPSQNESDSDNDLSTYTNAHTYDKDSFMIMDRKRSNKPIRPGDAIEYYLPIGVSGDKKMATSCNS